MMDLIERKAALYALCEDCKSKYDGLCPHEASKCIEYRAINRLPAIEAEPVRHRLGAWDRETAVKYWNSVNRWIPCSEMLPEKNVEVLAYSPYWGKIVVAMWGGEYWLEQWTDDDLEQSEITHWMPLPEPPESGAQDEAQP